MNEDILELLSDEDGNINPCEATYSLMKLVFAINIRAFEGDLQKSLDHVNEHSQQVIEFYKSGGVEH